jgi:polyhydroxyalkanoate synthesis repressor PhaR
MERTKDQPAIVIKRYPNRKLYNTETKSYITLEGIATLIREGQEVHVIDHATSEDLTAVTLTQIILEQEKKRKGFVPQVVLTSLVQAGGETMGTLRRALASSLDLARQVDEEIERRLQALVSQGELAADEGLHLRDQLVTFSQRTWGKPAISEQDLERVLTRRGVPTRDDLQEILGQLDTLADELDRLSQRKEST